MSGALAPVAHGETFVIGIRAMATPQDPPTRKKQKARATRKLAEWRKKQAAKTGTAEKKTTATK
jgi:hypothetical protein